MRIHRFTAVLCLFLFVITPLAAQQPQSTPPPPATTQEAAPTPEMFWNALLTGNKQFVAGKLTYDKLAEERKLLANGQYPPMTILSCSDSRIPPELVFNQSLGALFVVRSAGNVTDTLGVSSIEYAIAQGWTMLVVVLAHEDCGAVKSAMVTTDPASPNLLALMTRIRGSFFGIPWDPNDPVAVRRATIANAKASAASLLAQSAIVRQAVKDGKVKVVVAYYSTSTGVVERVE